MAQKRRKPVKRAPAGPRMSISCTPKLRRKIRLAAALAGLEDGEYCKTVLATAAAKIVNKAFPALSDPADRDEDDDE